MWSSQNKTIERTNEYGLDNYNHLQVTTICEIRNVKNKFTGVLIAAKQCIRNDNL